MTTVDDKEELEFPAFSFGDVAQNSRGMPTSATASVASSSRILRTPASAPVVFSSNNRKAPMTDAAAADSSIKSDHQKSAKVNVAAELGNSLHSSPQLMCNSNSRTPQRIKSSVSRRDLEQKIRNRSNRDRNNINNNATFNRSPVKLLQRKHNENDIGSNDKVEESNNLPNSKNSKASSAPIPKALTDLLLQTAILGIDTTAKLSRPTLALTKNTLLPQIILPLLRELWETYAPDRLQTWMKVLPSSVKNLHDLLWETDAGKQLGQKSLQLGEDVVDMISSDVGRQYWIDITVTFIKLLDALHTPEVRTLLDQFAISMCRLVDVMSSGKAKQVWFDVSDTIWAALEVGSDEVMVLALAEGCAKICFALERERESLKKRRKGRRSTSESGGGGGDDYDGEIIGKSGKAKTERLISARRRKERDQRQLGTYPPGKEVLRDGGGRSGIEEALMDGLGGFTRDIDQQQLEVEYDSVACAEDDDDADKIYMNMSSIDRPPQRVIVPTSSADQLPEAFNRPDAVMDTDDESEITTEIEDLRRHDGVVTEQWHCDDFDTQSSSGRNQKMVDNNQRALAYEDERGNIPNNSNALFSNEAVDDNDEDQQDEEVSEHYDNFDEPILQFYRRLNDVLTETRKEVKLREALETQQNETPKNAPSKNIRNDDKTTDPITKVKHSNPSYDGLFSFSKKWWKLLLISLMCGMVTMCLLWVALSCYGFYVIFIAESHLSMPAAQMHQPIVIQIAPQGSNNACYEAAQPSPRDLVSLSLDDWNELKRDVDAAIAKR